MALSELNAAIPEKLPVKFAYNELGHRFESVQSKRLVQLLPRDLNEIRVGEAHRLHAFGAA